MAPVLFLLAMLARALIPAVATHWACIIVASVMGTDLDEVVPVTMIVTILVVLAVAIGIVAGRSQPGGKERMSAGPGMITQWRSFVLTVGVASNFGGLVTFVAGNPQAGSWAMGMGTAIVAFEISAICGAAVLESISTDRSK